MIKLFTLFNVVGLFLFNMLLGSDVSIVQNMPERIDPGTEVRVTVTVTKAQISGFAKLQIDLPPGFTATAIDTRGASFTFADGKAKFIWMALPTQSSFKVSYTLSADADANGTFPVTARLSYIEDNERKTADMAPATITVGSGTAVASNPVPAPDAASNAMDLASAAETGMIPDVAVTDTPDLPSQKGPGDVSATRTITAVSNTELLVEVTVQKGLLRGFGKLQENLPEGFTAVVKEEDDAIFSTKDRIAKFVWLNLPSKSEIKVSYRLLAPTGASGTFTVNGEFGYLLNDLTQRAVVGSTSFTLDSEAMAAEIPPTQQPEATPPANQQTGTSQEAAKPAVTSPTTNAQSQEGAPKQNGTTAQATTPKASSTPAPESGITFKVQITAAHREVGQAYFIQRHRYDGPFSIEHNDGWIKYVTGMFDRYRSARDQRQAYLDANYNFPGPFVTAYNNGERITVQEALMIAKQSSVQ
ncbi:MAG: hypothetical protein K8H89_04520 [Flavobacteriales bacterium]|jgi:hypothetical protein|nr:hypothetical protein [Flavobacteriales bacterium]MCB0757394.1 hypothetical protein [Flavobacteriales bacterium]